MSSTAPSWAQLSDDGVDAHERAGRHQDAIVVPPRDERRQIVEAGGELLDDVEKFECLEVGRRWFAVRTSFRSKLSVEILEERRRCSDLIAAWAHAWSVDSVSAMIFSTRARTRARNSGGTWSRSVTMLASKIALRSVGLICSSSAAVQIFDAMLASYLSGPTPLMARSRCRGRATRYVGLIDRSSVAAG
jgi:hypothetical protein